MHFLFENMNEKLQQKKDLEVKFSMPLLLGQVESSSPIGRKALENFTPNSSFSYINFSS